MSRWPRQQVSESWNLKKKFEDTATSTMSRKGHLLTKSRIPAGSKVSANPSFALSGVGQICHLEGATDKGMCEKHIAWVLHEGIFWFSVFGVVLIFVIFRFGLISCTFGSDSRGWNELGCRKDYREPCRLHRSLTQYGKNSFSLGPKMLKQTHITPNK